MRKAIPEKIKKLVAKRANYRCEYCHLPEAHVYFSFQIEHIISLKHGGTNEASNLAYSCPICNRNKGSDLGTLIGDPPILTPFFHPRENIWSDHFELNPSGEITGISPTARATIKILEFNHPDAILQRRILIEAKNFPLT